MTYASALTSGSPLAFKATDLNDLSLKLTQSPGSPVQPFMRAVVLMYAVSAKEEGGRERIGFVK